MYIGIVRGYVIDSTNDFPIQDVLVITDTISDTTGLANTPPYDVTDSTGYYHIIIVAGVENSPISAFSSNYFPKTKYFSVGINDSVTVNFNLKQKSKYK